jgi:hypothetical protein
MCAFSNNDLTSAPRRPQTLQVNFGPTGEHHHPVGGIHDDRVSAPVAAAIDQEPARAGLAHFPERDCWRCTAHDSAAEPGLQIVNPLRIGPRRRYSASWVWKSGSAQ